jgi:hypothetical protein
MAVDQTVAMATNRFLRDGGLYALPLQKLREQGVFPEEGATPYQEYPKIIRLNPREVVVKRMVELCDKSTVPDEITKTVYDEYTVNSEAEEERVLAGGKTSAQIEEERQGLLVKCSHMGIAADPSWSTVRLKRLLGESLDSPAPADEMGALKAKLERLEEMAAMRARIAALEAQLAKPAEDDIEELRAELSSLGVEVDMRWSVKTLRTKLEQATAPQEQAA